MVILCDLPDLGFELGVVEKGYLCELMFLLVETGDFFGCAYPFGHVWYPVDIAIHQILCFWT